jgi:hypothetical protein
MMMCKFQAYYVSLFISAIVFCYLTAGRQVIEKEGSLTGAIVHSFTDFLVSCCFLLISALAFGADVCSFLQFKKYELNTYLIPVVYELPNWQK